MKKPLNPNEALAIAAIIEYLSGEQKHFEENPTDNHIWNHVLTLQELLNRNEETKTI